MTSDLPVEALAADLTFPTSVTFDPSGTAYVAESGLPFGGAPAGGRIWALPPGGHRRLVADGLGPPVTGLTYHDGGLYVSEGGPGRINRIEPGGHRTVLVDGLPGPGNYQTNMAMVGPDGALYFSQGAMTNAGIVGLDAYELGWLRRLPHAHDEPGLELRLAGVNVETPDPLASGDGARVSTGAFAPFGTPTEPGQRVPARLPCTAAVMRRGLDGSGLELVAWGLRNAFGMAFLPDGRLLAIDQGADDRGSRPVGNAPDLLFEVRTGAWYGWPDFIDGRPVTDPRYAPERGPAPTPVLANHEELPPPEPALAGFPPHTAATKLAVAPAGSDWAGDIAVACFGDEQPMTAPAGLRAERGVARVSPDGWRVGPLVRVGERPIDVAFDPVAGQLHMLDFGRFEVGPSGAVEAEPGSGALWRLRQVAG
jgi:glucose/arabinose dehydrogenase